MKIYVCKMCGRAMKCEEPPKFCYFDRMDGESQGLESLDKEQAFFMGLRPLFVNSDEEKFEFPGDVRYDQMTGSAADGEGFTLTEFQDEVLEKCLTI